MWIGTFNGEQCDFKTGSKNTNNNIRQINNFLVTWPIYCTRFKTELQRKKKISHKRWRTKYRSRLMFFFANFEKIKKTVFFF